ncbi:MULTISPECIES: RagB/SusD family nutrient uptake outer membrane protein [Chryseobacterium]|uniref:Outer membrane starch-binding protein n=1 Tax=Chryseobacterium geocarposphaerae TaxID=1416776 RepID=A0ABU1LF42_9FLAO|nr:MULTISPECIES: RagB/SusD family nutrient uptake outer membrane protein [Chryseobacterium]MDR6405332.1 hypothetical protein [Chryseobacterium geocarposphaerae]MDR6697491.1 hypothetical protein [Chryseobacterium ginsenosidimutans]
MKNIFYKLLTVCFACTVLVSCKDAIDIVQEGELNDQTVFKTTSDLEKYLLGSVYTSVDVTNQIKFSSVFTDELKVGPSNTGQDQGLYRYVLTPGDGYATAIWQQNYTNINRVNRLLEAAEKITPAASETATYNNILAEARTLRALAYLNLESYFSPNMADDNTLGVILINRVPAIDEQLPRSKNGDIWALVEADLQYAENNLAPPTSHNFPFFASKTLVNAMRARMYLYRKNYTLAKQYAQSVVTNSGVSLTVSTPVPTGTPGTAAWNTAFYAAAPTNPYRRLWADLNNGENLFTLSRPVSGTGGNIAGIYTTNTTNLSGSPLWTVGLNLFNRLNVPSTTTPQYSLDIRRYAFIDPTSVPAQGVYIIDKYPGKTNAPLRNDVKVFRLSEMYFILAECEAQTPAGYVAAATYIKAVRDARRFNSTAALPVYSSKVDALRDILAERRAELAFEGHRYVDLRRLGAEAGVSIDRNANDDFNPNTPLTLNITDYRFTLPIPSAEILGNPSIQQNPGY